MRKKNAMPADYLQRFRVNLRYVLRERGAKTKLSATAQLTTVYISRLIARQSSTSPSLLTALAICRATGYSIGEYLLLPANFVDAKPGERPPASVGSFLASLAEYLEGGNRGIKQIVAAEIGITTVYLSRLLRAAREHEETDISLRVALSIAQAIDIPLDRMVADEAAVRH